VQTIKCKSTKIFSNFPLLAEKLMNSAFADDLDVFVNTEGGINTGNYLHLNKKKVGR
jgi:hypothetical protein